MPHSVAEQNDFANDFIYVNHFALRSILRVAAGAAALVPHHLNTVQTNVQYHFGSRFEATGAFFNITGTADPLLYAQAPVFGSASGSPSSTGYIVEGSWWPRQNFKFGAQYTGYTRFNGQGTNYDVAGRKASANNSIYLIALFTF